MTDKLLKVNCALMAIRYLDGRRLQRTFIAAANCVNVHRESLNSINVFPVPDGDAGPGAWGIFYLTVPDY